MNIVYKINCTNIEYINENFRTLKVKYYIVSLIFLRELSSGGDVFIKYELFMSCLLPIKHSLNIFI